MLKIDLNAKLNFKDDFKMRYIFFDMRKITFLTIAPIMNYG